MMTTSSQTRQPDPEKSPDDILEINYESLMDQTQVNGSGQNDLSAPASLPGQHPAWTGQGPEQPGSNGRIPHSFRGMMDGATDFPEEHLLDSAVLHYEYDRRRRNWWESRRWLVYVPTALFLIFLIFGLVGLLIKSSLAAVWFIAAVVVLVLGILLLFYTLWTRPRVLSFGRTYRQFIAVPLERGGLVWNDPAKAAPDFPAMRDNFFALYRDSDDMGSKMQPADDEETARKKRTLSDLNALIAPLKSSSLPTTESPYVSAEMTAEIDNLWLQPLYGGDFDEVAGNTSPAAPRQGQLEELERLAHEVEDYSGLDELKSDTGGGLSPSEVHSIHSLIAERVAQNLNMVASEIQRWQERSEREQTFNTGAQSRYAEAAASISDAYARVESALDTEIRPALHRLEAQTAFYRSQIQRFYNGQIEKEETLRDSELAKLDQEHNHLQNNRDERQDEQRLLQAELKGLNEQRQRLDNSTNQRFEGLKQLLGELTDRAYALPPAIHFRSDIASSPLTIDSEETLRLLAQLRADTRLATGSVHSAMNRYARLRFDPLDELGRLRQQISVGNKWQATAYLGNLINFRQSGQLLALAGEVGDAVGVYLDSIGEFERLNGIWCGLEASIRELGLTTYANQLNEAQRYLESLEEALTSLYSSLMMAPHSPEMARPSTFQNLYDLAAGLQRELDELGGLAGAIARTQERLSELEAELSQLEGELDSNESKTETQKHTSETAISELHRKLNATQAKLDELKAERIKKIRAHIDSLNQSRDAEIARLGTGASALAELSDISLKILQKHFRQSQNLLSEANSLRQNLEISISSIVQEFELSSQADRSLRTASEVYVPVWYFQLSERPVWGKRFTGFATCYSRVARQGYALNSFWRFAFTNRPAVFYALEEDPRLEALVQVDNLEYPAGQVQNETGAADWLVANGWASSWLVKLLRSR